MILFFADHGTEDIFNGVNSVFAHRVFPRAILKVTFRKLDQLDSASKLLDLRIPSGNRLEALSGDREGQLSTRMNDQYRI